MSVRQIAVVLGLVFVVALAVVVGKQMSTEAMAVVIGIVCGVAAGIPTSILLLIALTRRDRQRAEEAERQTRQANYPPVVVIQGGMPQAIPPMSPMGYWPAQAPAARTTRQFHIVGGDELLSGDED